MVSEEHEIVIIGGGLTGLTLACLLKKSGIESLVLEARNRLGGRIHTKYTDNEAPVELGATWLGKKHKFLNDLLEELDIEIFIQELGKSAVYEPISTSPPQLVVLPPNEYPSFRITNGSSSLINKLASKLSEEQIQLNSIVKSIKKTGDKLKVEDGNKTYEAALVVSTLPPKLLVNSVNFSPPLPSEFQNIANNTHTWMGESIKVCLTYDKPFWRASTSGTMFSNVGPISELYDHSNVEDTLFALKGFMNGGFAGAIKEQRKDFTLNQLSKYYGEQVRNFLSYSDTAWKNEKFTHKDYKGYILPHQNNGKSQLRSTFYSDSLLIAGSETAPSHPGYMDGAVESAIITAERILAFRQFSDKA